MEGWQKGAQAVIKMSAAGRNNYFKRFPERREWFEKNHPEHFGRSAAVATTSLKKVNKTKVQKQRLAAIRQAAEKRDQLKVSSAAVQAMGVRRREGGEGLGGGLETNRDIISHVRGGGTIGSGGLGSLFEQEKEKTQWGVYKDEEGNWYYNGNLMPSEAEAKRAEKEDQYITNNRNIIRGFMDQLDALSKKSDATATDSENNSTTSGTPRKIGDRIFIKGKDGEPIERVWSGTGWISPDSYGGLPPDRSSGFRDPKTGESVDGVTQPLEVGRDWPKPGEDPNWGATLGMVDGWMGDRDKQFEIIRTPPAGAQLPPNRGKRLPFSPIVQGGDLPIDQAKKRGGYFTGKNMEDLSRVNEDTNNMSNEENAVSQFARELAEKVIQEKRLQECMPMAMESKPSSSEAEDEPGEYDYEGDMAKSQLRSIGYNAKMLHDMLEDNTNLPEWVQSKITLAEDYILTAANYMRGEMDMNEATSFPAGGGVINYNPKTEKSEMEGTANLGDDQLPFEPNATRPEMPAGKQPSEYRYVRNLARKALKAKIMSMQQPQTADELVAQHNALHQTVSEEAEQLDELKIPVGAIKTVAKRIEGKIVGGKVVPPKQPPKPPVATATPEPMPPGGRMTTQKAPKDMTAAEYQKFYTDRAQNRKAVDRLSREMGLKGEKPIGPSKKVMQNPYMGLDELDEAANNDLVPQSMLPDKSAIPPGKGFGDDIKREKIKQKTAKAIEKKRNALPTDNPSENELVPQSMLPDKPGYPPGYVVPEPAPTTIVTDKTKPMMESESPFVNAASKFLTRTSARLVYGEKND